MPLCCQPHQNQRFASLGKPRRIWAIGAIHADVTRLAVLHDRLFPLLRPGDRIVYTGNYTGYGAHPLETIDELLAFRSGVLSRPGMLATDIAFLRGGQEEMGQKILQIQFATGPADVIKWMGENGFSETVNAYGFSLEDAAGFAREGVSALTRWSLRLGQTIRSRPGHIAFITNLRRAAHTDTDPQCAAPILFVHSGIKPDKPWDSQEDSYWWASKSFDRMMAPPPPFVTVVRGCDPSHKGISMRPGAVTLDAGCGFGGPLACAGFDEAGNIFDIINI